MIMDVDEARKIRSSAELNVGDEIEAWHNGKLFHRGPVTQTVTGVDLFWILDARTGSRRLIDAEALVILRPVRTGSAAANSPAPSRAPASTPVHPSTHPSADTSADTSSFSAHMPLFQAPSLAGQGPARRPRIRDLALPDGRLVELDVQ